MALRLPADWSPKQRLAATLRQAWSDIHGPAFVRMVADVLAQPPGVPRAVRALVLVQGLPYRPDAPGVDDVQSVSETAATGGDCEDLAALVAVLCKVAGLPARLLWLFQRDRVRDHVTAQVRIDSVWVWLEPTVRARFGENPYSAAKRLGEAQRALRLGAVV